MAFLQIEVSVAEVADLVSCNDCRWSDRQRIEYAEGGCMMKGLQERFWQTGSQVRCGLFTRITMARRKLIDDRKRTPIQETLF
jgi:hypothetical protein